MRTINLFSLVVFVILLSLFSLDAQAQNDCSTDESKCWSEKTDSAIPSTPAKGKIGGKDVAGFYVELHTKADSMTGKKYVRLMPSNEKPATPCSQVKGSLIQIGFKKLPPKGTFTLNKSKDDKSAMMQTIAYAKQADGGIKSTSGKSDVTFVLKKVEGDEATGKVSIKFLDGKTLAEGGFKAHVCK